MTNANALHDLKRRNLVWQANQHACATSKLSSGYAELDEKLLGGLPEQGLMLVQSAMGIGELRLLMPYLKQQSIASQKLLVLIAPPMQINGEMLQHYGISLEQVLIITPTEQQQALWAAEQCLKSGTCHTVVLWQHHINVAQAKRLQLSAKKGQALQVIFNQDAASISLPVSLILDLQPLKSGLRVEIKKHQGHWVCAPFELNMQAHWPELTIANPVDTVVPIYRAS